MKLIQNNNTKYYIVIIIEIKCPLFIIIITYNYVK